jgi:type I restriction enzyme M protein
MHFTLKTDPLKREDLDDFVKCYNPQDRHHRKPTWGEGLDSGSPALGVPGQAGAGMTGQAGAGMTADGRWRAYTYDELIARDKASLDILWLKDESLSDSDNLPAPDLIAQEIVDDLEAALEQFRLIAGDLNGRAEGEAA